MNTPYVTKDTLYKGLYPHFPGGPVEVRGKGHWNKLLKQHNALDDIGPTEMKRRIQEPIRKPHPDLKRRAGELAAKAAYELRKITVQGG